MKKILVPVDFSDYSKQALDFAIEFNEKANGQIVLLHVFDAPIVREGTVDQATQDDLQIWFKENLIKQVENKLETWGSILTEKKINHTKKLLYGNPYEQITSQITQEKADLIIMGSKGASGLKEVLIGSNAERVVRNATCPVIIIKDETHIDEIRNIVFATDGSENSDKAAQHAKKLQNLLDLKIHLLKIRTFQFETEEKDIETLHGFVRRNAIENYTLNSFEAAFPDEGIIRFCEQIRAGIIVMATEGRKGLYHLIGGSWAEDIVNESKTPVMTFNIGD